MRTEILRLILYFTVGIVQDFFFTLNTRYIAREKVLPAVFYSFLTVLISMLILYNILTALDAERSILAIIVYSLGIATGTYVAMKLPGRKKK